MPVFSLIHLFFRLPPKSCKPAIAKIKKKKTRMIKVSPSKGSELRRA
jgi:hypothetical protein